MSTSGAPTSAPAAPSSIPRRFLRPQLRQATFVLPRTGQRVKGLVNLHNPRISASASASTSENDERRGLLSGEISNSHNGYGTGSGSGSGYDQSQGHGLLSTIKSKSRNTYTHLSKFTTSEQGIGILKFSLAYLLGSLATFIPALSAFLGQQDGKHMVATVTVYFHPARSVGSMYRALICAGLAFCYSAFLSVSSMLFENLFQDTFRLPALGHALVLIVFCGGGLGFVGWTKQRLGGPLVNVACSLTSLSTITVLTKEGAVQSGDLSLRKISQVLKMVVMGVIAATMVSFLIFPISARRKLRANLVTAADTIAEMLALITEAFLSGSEEVLKSDEFRQIEAKHRKAYGMLDNLVREAKLEHFVAGTEKEYRLEKNLVRWVQDITHNLGGLRSAASLQFSLIRETIARESGSSGEGEGNEQNHPHGSVRDYFATLERSWSFPDGSILEPIEERSEEDLSPSGTLNSQSSKKDDTDPMLPADVFTIFITHLGPAMRSLAFTMKEIFNEIPFGAAPNYKVSVDSRLRTSLDRALELYRESREKTLKQLYQQTQAMKMKSPEAEADLEEVSASCGHFSFSLMEFGEQLRELLGILDELQLESEERPNGRSWSWLKFWKYKGAAVETEPSFMAPIGPENRISATAQARLRPFAERSVKERLGYRLWKSLEFFRRDDTKYAIKVGAGAALYALPAFLPSTRPFYTHWRGEWGLLSYMLVCSMTIGASNTTGYARFFGTCLGALCAIFSWVSTGGNVYGLAFLGWVMAAWTAWITIVKGNGPMGRFIMLTYNLSVLYAYTLSQKEGGGGEGDRGQDEGGPNPIISEIALHRVVAVFSGCLWGVIITRMIWPISARERLKDGLSLLWLRLGLVWKRDPLSCMEKSGRSVVYMTARERLELERFLSRLESLLVSARSEFELRSAFADQIYTSIIRRTRNMVNAFHAMNLELMKSDMATEGEICLLRYTANERRQLSARISHLLSVMASSMKLEYPLSDVLPSIEHARDRLLARIYRYRQDHDASQLTTDEDCALLYAYILVTGQLSQEIMEIIAEIGQLFGVLSEDVMQLA